MHGGPNPRVFLRGDVTTLCHHAPREGMSFSLGQVDANGVRAEGSILNGISGQDVEVY